jgi:hypothetical protein
MEMKMREDDSLDVPVWGAAAIGRVINREARPTFHMLENGQLPAEKIGGRWVSTPRRLLGRILGSDVAA